LISSLIKMLSAVSSGRQSEGRAQGTTLDTMLSPADLSQNSSDLEQLFIEANQKL
jgi:hypothetical protein